MRWLSIVSLASGEGAPQNGQGPSFAGRKLLQYGQSIGIHPLLRSRACATSSTQQSALQYNSSTEAYSGQELPHACRANWLYLVVYKRVS